MRKWYVPITVLGLGGLGTFLFSERGKSLIRSVRDRRASRSLLEWNDAAQAELDRIQMALNSIAESLQPHSQPGS